MYLPDGSLLQGGKYRIERYISHGGFGCTYVAVHTMVGIRLAIKEFFVSDFCTRDATGTTMVVTTGARQELVSRLLDKFVDEARALFAFDHPGIVKINDIFRENGTAYIVMNYIDGCTIQNIIDTKGRLPERQALRYIRQVCDALAYVHDKNRLHLDIKPGNIMVDHNDNAILIDFGVSKQYDEVNGENTSTLMGNTPGYAPLEQMGNNVSKFAPATDIYALGATLYKMLTGNTPPAANQLADDDSLPPIPTDAASPATCQAVYAAMEVRRTQRPQSIAQFLAILDGKVTSQRKPQPASAPPKAEATVHSPMASPGPDKKPSPTPAEVQLGKNINHTPDQKPSSTTPYKLDEQDAKARKTPMVMIAIVAAVVLLLGAGLWYGLSSDDSQIQENNEEYYATDEVSDNTDSPTQYVAPKEDNNASELTFTVKDIPFKMIYVKGGTFDMGSNDGNDDEKPVHKVTLSDYYIGETEVTQELWTAVMGSNPSIFIGQSNLPVETISWEDCHEFVKKLNALTGKTFSLPTEAEWEYAARGGNLSHGYRYSGSENYITDVAWICENSGDKTHPVKGKKPNELGLYDMSGNVWEWCSDWYGDYSSSWETNPTGPGSGSYRVYRGGSWDSLARDCRVANRNGLTPGGGDYSRHGLRLCLRP